MFFLASRCSDAGPVPDVRLLVAVIVRGEVVLPHVVLGVEMVLVDVMAHADVGEDVLEFGVVRERDRREWVEVVGVNGLGFADVGELFSKSGLGLACLTWFPSAEVHSYEGRVDKHVGSPAHATESA